MDVYEYNKYKTIMEYLLDGNKSQIKCANSSFKRNQKNVKKMLKWDASFH